MKSKYIAYIYCLECNEIPFYIGITISYKKRMLAHRKKYNNFTHFIVHAIHSNKQKEFEIEKSFWENHYISLYKSFGFDLKNVRLNNKIKKFKKPTKKVAITVVLKNKTIDNIEEEAKKLKRTTHYLMVETLEDKFGK